MTRLNNRQTSPMRCLTVRSHLNEIPNQQSSRKKAP